MCGFKLDGTQWWAEHNDGHVWIQKKNKLWCELQKRNCKVIRYSDVGYLIPMIWGHIPEPGGFVFLQGLPFFLLIEIYRIPVHLDWRLQCPKSWMHLWYISEEFFFHEMGFFCSRNNHPAKHNCWHLAHIWERPLPLDASKFQFFQHEIQPLVHLQHQSEGPSSIRVQRRFEPVRAKLTMRLRGADPDRSRSAVSTAWRSGISREFFVTSNFEFVATGGISGCGGVSCCVSPVVP